MIKTITIWNKYGEKDLIYIVFILIVYQNLEILYSRIEEVPPLNVDLIVSRAVGKMIDVWQLSKKHLKKNGYFVIYKSKLLNEEINEFNSKYKNTNQKTIKYTLPLNEQFDRNLIVFQN